ncbi:unnamed protein product [Urochloa humidicola]
MVVLSSIAPKELHIGEPKHHDNTRRSKNPKTRGTQPTNPTPVQSLDRSKIFEKTQIHKTPISQTHHLGRSRRRRRGDKPGVPYSKNTTSNLPSKRPLGTQPNKGPNLHDWTENRCSPYI